jgi:deoxycitidine kinase/deoxyguanosine kinase
MFIAIEGNIGAGKSTLLKALQERCPSAIVCQEDIEKWNTYMIDDAPILEAFYKNKEAHAFTLQMAILLSRVKTMLEYREMNKLVFVERSMFADANVFCKMLNESDAIISDAQMSIVEDWVKTFSEMCTIDMYIYLDVPVDTCLERVSKRNRSGETEISKEYLHQLHIKHQEWFRNEDFNIPMVYLTDNEDEDIDSVMRFIENHFPAAHPEFKRT